MDFALSPRAAELAASLEDFMRDPVYPAESVYREQMREAGTPHYQPPVLEELKEQARARGLRYLRLADGPDEVHRTVVAKLELRKYAGR